MTPTEKLVTVAKFLEPTNAQMAKGMLEAAGIECFLQGEQANSLMALAFRARLQVAEADVAAARSLLAETDDVGFENNAVGFENNDVGVENNAVGVENHDE